LTDPSGASTANEALGVISNTAACATAKSTVKAIADERRRNNCALVCIRRGGKTRLGRHRLWDGKCFFLLSRALSVGWAVVRTRGRFVG
jgi:hypothetical protein